MEIGILQLAHGQMVHTYNDKNILQKSFLFSFYFFLDKRAKLWYYSYRNTKEVKNGQIPVSGNYRIAYRFGKTWILQEVYNICKNPDYTKKVIWIKPEMLRLYFFLHCIEKSACFL